MKPEYAIYFRDHEREVNRFFDTQSSFITKMETLVASEYDERLGLHRIEKEKLEAELEARRPVLQAEGKNEQETYEILSREYYLNLDVHDFNELNREKNFYRDNIYKIQIIAAYAFADRMLQQLVETCIVLRPGRDTLKGFMAGQPRGPRPKAYEKHVRYLAYLNDKPDIWQSNFSDFKHYIDIRNAIAHNNIVINQANELQPPYGYFAGTIAFYYENGTILVTQSLAQKFRAACKEFLLSVCQGIYSTFDTFQPGKN